jgi:hypothetical protein
MNIPPSGGNFFHAAGQSEGWADTTKLIVAFRSFVNTPKVEGFVRVLIENLKITSTTQNSL